MGFFLAGIGIMYAIWNYMGAISFVDFFFGTGEKRHGVLFFSCLALFYVIYREYSDQRWQRLIEMVLLLSGAFVSVYAILQFIGLDFVPVKYAQMPWGIGRVFSALGNPNYLAGFLLLLFPMLAKRRFSKSWGYWLLFVVVMILTGSVAGNVLMLAFFLYIGFKNKLLQISMYKRILLFILIGVIGLGSLIFIPQGEKFLSLASRFSLGKSWIQVEKQEPVSLLVGHGPDTIFSAASGGRIVLDGAYFPAGSKLDSFHNVFLDFVFFFGIPLTGILLFFMIRRWKYISMSSKEGIILFISFFFINIPISIHFLIMTYFLATDAKNN